MNQQDCTRESAEEAIIPAATANSPKRYETTDSQEGVSNAILRKPFVVRKESRVDGGWKEFAKMHVND